MATVEFILHGDLPLLAGDPRQARYTRRLPEPGAVKDSLEALGIPHTEIDLLLCESQPIGFNQQIRGAEKIEAFPTPAALGQGLIWPTHRLQPRPLARERFLCDQHLGKLARLLRLLGFDTLCEPEWGEPELAGCAVAEQRALLTCSRALLKRKRITCGGLIVSRELDAQAAQTIRRYGLAPLVRPFGRCSLCNGLLQDVALEEVRHRVPPRTRQWRNQYFLCLRCDHIYWKGTHVARLQERIAALLEAAAVAPG